jgi:hypothetical protein
MALREIRNLITSSGPSPVKPEAAARQTRRERWWSDKRTATGLVGICHSRALRTPY